jgi:hypothetical protein
MIHRDVIFLKKKNVQVSGLDFSLSTSPPSLHSSVLQPRVRGYRAAGGQSLLHYSASRHRSDCDAELTPINAVESTLSIGAQFMFNILKPLDSTSAKDPTPTPYSL